MKLKIATISAIEALRSNLLRSFLTMLGIMIGVASVMAMMAISEGAAEQVDAQISSLGANNLTIRPGASRRGGRSSGAASALAFDENMVQALRSEPYVIAVSAENSGQVMAVSGETNWSTNLRGVNTDYFIAEQWDASDGRVLEERDVSSAAAVALIGKTLADTLFEGTNPIGQRIRAQNVPLSIVGVLEEKGQSNFGTDRDDLIIVPITTARNRILGGDRTVAKHVSTIEVTVAEGYDMAEVQELLEERMRELRGLKVGSDDDFRVFNVADFIRARSETQTTFGVLLAFTAAVSLLVGGVGVMNIMLVSVTERTREIGLRMAVGAKKADILSQFLIEALALCFIGGLIGSVLGFGAAELASAMGNFPVKVSATIALIALGASAAVGLFFGFFPARRAAMLNPIEALRYD